MLEGVRLRSESKQTVNYDWRVKQACAVLDDDDDGIIAYYVDAVFDSFVTLSKCFAVNYEKH